MLVLSRQKARNISVMAEIFAECCPGPPLIRKDTRVYFSNGHRRSQNRGNCVGTLWMCNPGGRYKRPQPWGPWPTDDTMRAVAPIIDQAQSIAVSQGRGALRDDYLQILNLFYVCDSSPSSGRATYSTSLNNYHEPPNPLARFTWIAWSQDAEPAWLPGKAIWSALPDPFFYSKPKRMLISGVPQSGEYATHPRAFAIHGLTDAPGVIAQRIAQHL